tara:strand:- start:3660 stop:3917 length:258 start_codon:yes stop_codon:yes gene_type:complete
MPKIYRKIISKCEVMLEYKNGETVYIVMDLDLNDSIDDQICNAFVEADLKKWWWREINGPSMRELRDMLFEDYGLGSVPPTRSRL